MKIVIVGGSSQSTPALFAAPEIERHLDVLEVTLVGRTREKLQAVSRAIGILTGARARVTIARPEEVSFAGVDLVLCQARYGGYEARVHDERFPLEIGIPGDEGLGPGGLANAWRSWPPLLEVLTKIHEQALETTIVLLSSPLGLLTRCALDMFPDLRFFGLCELPWTTLQTVCTRAGADPIATPFEYAGINHLGWFDRIEGSTECVGLKYLRLHYDRETVVEEQRASEPRGLQLHRLEARAQAAFEGGDSEAIRLALCARPAPWYSDAVAPLVEAMIEGQSTIPFFLTKRNNGYLPSFHDNDIVEVPHRYVDGAFQPFERHHALTPNIEMELERFVRYERIAARAVFDRSREGLIDALEVHPWVAARAVAEQLASRATAKDVF